MLQRRLAKIEVRYAECPNICGQTEKPASEACAGCPIIKADQRFKKETLAALDERIGDGWKKYSFESLQKSVAEVEDLEAEGDNGWYIGTEILVRIFQQERNKIERGEHQDFMARMKSLNKTNGGQ